MQWALSCPNYSLQLLDSNRSQPGLHGVPDERTRFAGMDGRALFDSLFPDPAASVNIDVDFVGQLVCRETESFSGLSQEFVPSFPGDYFPPSAMTRN